MQFGQRQNWRIQSSMVVQLDYSFMSWPCLTANPVGVVVPGDPWKIVTCAKFFALALFLKQHLQHLIVHYLCAWKRDVMALGSTVFRWFVARATWHAFECCGDERQTDWLRHLFWQKYRKYHSNFILKSVHVSLNFDQMTLRHRGIISALR